MDKASGGQNLAQSSLPRGKESQVADEELSPSRSRLSCHQCLHAALIAPALP